MQVELTTHENAVSENFEPTKHADVFLDAKAGKVAILQDNDQAIVIAIDS